VKGEEAMTANKIGAFVGPVPEMNNFTGKKGSFYVIALV
jgi:hypothetical protein